jgi:hypothetical protein
LPEGEANRLIDDGTLTGLATYPVFLPREKYASQTKPCSPAHPDVPVLADENKHNGFTNFNNECYVPITAEALHNALAAGRARPASAARAVAGSFEIWAESSSQYAFVYDNRTKIDSIDTPYRQVILLDVAWDPPVHTRGGWWIPIGTPGGRWRISLTIILATVIAAVAGIRGGWRVLRRRATPIDTALAVMGFTVVTLTLVGNIFEIGENNRFRFMVEPITLAAGVWFATGLCRLVRRRYRRRQSTGGLPLVAGVAEAEPARLGPHGETVRVDAHGDAGEQPAVD